MHTQALRLTQERTYEKKKENKENKTNKCEETVFIQKKTREREREGAAGKERERDKERRETKRPHLDAMVPESKEITPDKLKYMTHKKERERETLLVVNLGFGTGCDVFEDDAFLTCALLSEDEDLDREDFDGTGVTG